ncbi:MAG TPA: single-stranded DNA-binding protein [Aggregatilineales bacterium]|mgnify:FL=1|nr:single-stranded DNA-binding protein [Aggregatilineales bacterium]
MFQQCIIIGNLGRDPEMRFLGDGTPVTSFSVAVNRKWTGRDGNPGEKTWWFRVTCWGRLAETTNQYLRKGSPVMVIGEVDASAYIPREGGEPRASLELTARDVRFLPRGGSDMQDVGTGMDYPTEEEDIPF